MIKAIEILRSKGQIITDEEAKGVIIAILLHDIGHGPFSHALEHSLVHGIPHEEISDAFMDKLNKQFNNELSLAIKIFRNKYPKRFLHQMVSSQLDMDRLDYLRRDSFYTGVSEGVISTDRIITMLNVKNDELVVEEKGIYSIEKFIIARRLMYWQVYLHKTVLSAESLIINILKRAKELALNKQELFCTPALAHFLYKPIGKKAFFSSSVHLEAFSLLDDYDIFTSIKVWVNHPDKTLSTLCNNLINRKLYKIELSNKIFSNSYIDNIKLKVSKKLKLRNNEINYFVFHSEIINNAYNPKQHSIKLLNKNNTLTDIADAADQLNISVLSKPVKKYFLCYPKH
jgi:HD superfamily phosphohydrolase